MKKNCKQCDKAIITAKNSETARRKFCSRSCSSIYSNQHRFGKLKKECKCGKKIRSDIKHCLPCYKNTLTKRKTKYLEKTKGEIFNDNKNYMSARSAISGHARNTFNLKNKEKKCFICGYSKHVEVCHIKDVSDFANSSKLKEINNIANLIGLCPNHHWEFDNNLLNLGEIE